MKTEWLRHMHKTMPCEFGLCESILTSPDEFISLWHELSFVESVFSSWPANEQFEWIARWRRHTGRIAGRIQIVSERHLSSMELQDLGSVLSRPPL